MIRIENVETCGWATAVRGMRNPLNSWSKSDSDWHYYIPEEDVEVRRINDCSYCIGANDQKLMESLVKAGSDHSKFMRMIGISMDIIAPLYWWKEYDTHKVGTVANSCSTMHKITEKEFTLRDFSTDRLSGDGIELLSKHIIPFLEDARRWFNARIPDDAPKDKEQYWDDMIQILPASYNQRRTVTLNYAVARNQYHARKHHKLKEWREYCAMLEGLPYSKLITMEGKRNE